MEKNVDTVKKRIIIVANFCDYGNERTNNRFNYIAALLAENGYDVELVTSTFCHREKRQRSVTTDSNAYKSTIIYEPTYKKNVSLKRFLSHYVWGRGVAKYLKTVENPDLIYCAVPSIDAPYEVVKYCKRNNVPFVIDVQDLWPEAFQMALNIPIVSDILFFPFKHRIDKVYRAADAIVAVSETYAARARKVNKKAVESCVVYLGTRLEDFDGYCSSTERGDPNGKIRLAYCGTLGSSYDLTSVFDAMRILKDKGMDNLQFIIMGSGPLQKKFEQYAAEKGVDVIFTGKLPYADMCRELVRCDIAINCISKGSAGSIINKHADYAAAGIPIVSTQESTEFRALLDAYECGISCDSAEQLASAIDVLALDESKRQAMGKNARVLAEERFDRSISYISLLKIMEELSGL